TTWKQLVAAGYTPNFNKIDELGNLDTSKDPLCFLPPSLHQRTAKVAHGAIMVHGAVFGSEFQANNVRVLEPIILELLKLFGGEVTYDEVEYEENEELEIGASQVEPRSVCKEFRTRFGATMDLIVIEVKEEINMASFAQLFAEMTAMCSANAKAGNEEFKVYGILPSADEERKAASATASSTRTYSTYPFKYGGSVPMHIHPPLLNFFTQMIEFSDCVFTYLLLGYIQALKFKDKTKALKTARNALFHLTAPITKRVGETKKECDEILTEVEAKSSEGLDWLQKSVNSLNPRAASVD
ncbi:hypothetical protein BT96DRAFT_912806, partial [Gymnopus androsaceus JB14]